MCYARAIFCSLHQTRSMMGAAFGNVPVSCLAPLYKQLFCRRVYAVPRPLALALAASSTCVSQQHATPEHCHAQAPCALVGGKGRARASLSPLSLSVVLMRCLLVTCACLLQPLQSARRTRRSPRNGASPASRQSSSPTRSSSPPPFSSSSPGTVPEPRVALLLR